MVSSGLHEAMLRCSGFLRISNDAVHWGKMVFSRLALSRCSKAYLGTRCNLLPEKDNIQIKILQLHPFESWKGLIMYQFSDCTNMQVLGNYAGTSYDHDWSNEFVIYLSQLGCMVLNCMIDIFYWCYISGLKQTYRYQGSFPSHGVQILNLCSWGRCVAQWLNWNWKIYITRMRMVTRKYKAKSARCLS